MEPDIVLIFLAQLAILALLWKIQVLLQEILAHVRQISLQRNQITRDRQGQQEA
ncbi:hypothetical protein PGT21_012574 [Puccinia graminis f. sp. tritici]|uniref:Uncharacterized protein n=1 Tax=Puccinia graminis f. sp. tritici TaxID=56615 RepID=A0A5B0P6Q4_PUCGR|nr:hypothetical protein PGT21_012574 [Puccinia graminis f. sp. tritici]KAA1132114.1 hypothetical protein PGTUg99_037220 [Puccinia graminis f. sp. tritici]